MQRMPSFQEMAEELWQEYNTWYKFEQGQLYFILNITIIDTAALQCLQHYFPNKLPLPVL